MRFSFPPDHVRNFAQAQAAAVAVRAWRQAALAKPIPPAPAPAPVAPKLVLVANLPPTPCSGTRRLIHAILGAAADHCEVSVEDILGKSRRPNIARARALAMFLIRKSTSMSLPQIGKRIFRGKDHTTVLHGVRKIEASERLLAAAAEIAAAAQLALEGEGAAE